MTIYASMHSTHVNDAKRKNDLWGYVKKRNIVAQTTFQSAGDEYQIKYLILFMSFSVFPEALM